MAKYAPKFKKINWGSLQLTRKLLPLLLLSVVLFVSATWGSNAKYVHRSGGTGLVKAPEFYFTSDYLREEEIPYTLNPGTTSVTFQLRNYDGLKVSELPVEYAVKVNAQDLASGTISADTDSDISITLNGLVPGQEYKVEATGRNGYTKTLRAKFTVKSADENIYKHTEIYTDYVILTVWTQGIEANASVTIPAGLIPDYTDSRLIGKSAGESFNVDLGKNESQSFRFFTTAEYGRQPITVTYGASALPETSLN